MRTTDFCFLLSQLRVPAPLELPASLRDLRLALDPRTCTRDQETGGSGGSRRRIRFGGPSGVGATACCSERSRRTVPLTPLSLPALCTWLSRRTSCRFAKAASPASPWRWGELPDPGSLPSLGDPHAHA